jgi:predicted DNA-binding transcriptional regulator AlpA
MNFLRVKSVAQKLDVSKAAVWRFVKSGALPAPIKLSSRTTVWKESEIDEAILKIISEGV